MKLSNPWGRYEWKGIIQSIIQVDGPNNLMYGVSNFANNSISEKQMTDYSGSDMKISSKTSARL